MPKYVKRSALPEFMKDFSDAEIKEILSEAGEELEPDQPPTMPPLGDTGVDPNIYVGEALKQWKRAGQAGVAAGATMLGGGGPFMAALSGYLGRDVDPTTGHGMASTALNMGGGKIFELGKRIGPSMGPFLTGAKNAAIGAGEVGGAQMLGNVLSEGMGEKTTDLSFSDMLAGGAGAALLPPLFGKFVTAYQQAPPQLRAKMLPLIEALRQKVAPRVPEKPIPVNLEPMSVPQVQQAAAELPKPQNGLPANPYQYFVDKGLITPEPPELPAGDDLTALLEASLRARGKTPPPPVTPPPAPVLSAPKPTTPAAIPPTPEPTIAPAQTAPEVRDIYADADDYVKELMTRKPASPLLPRSAEDKVRDAIMKDPSLQPVVAAISKRGVTGYVDDVLSGDMQGLPALNKNLTAILPEKGKEILRERILTKIMDGVGEQGAFGDLSPIQKLKTFGGLDIGGKKGSQVLNDVFGSPDATEHLNNLYDAVERTLEQQLHANPTDLVGKLKVFVNNSGPVLGMGGLASGIPMMYFHVGPAIGAVATAAGTGKLIGVSMEKLGALVGRSRSKWSHMILDLVEGSEKYTPAQINALLSQLRKLGEEDNQPPATQ